MPDAPLIAIVDDDPSVRTATLGLLDAAGLSGAAFASAELFLASGRSATFSCLVADMRMPGISGLELHLHLAATGHHVPTVIITSHEDAATERRALEAGVTCYLIKPFTPGELLGCIRNALLKSRS